MKPSEKYPVMTKREIVVTVFLLLAVIISVLGLVNCTHTSTPQDYVGLVAKYIEVPEPINLIVWEMDTFAFSEVRPKSATIHYDRQAGWIVVINQEWFDSATHSRRILTFAHEMCHAVYDHDVLTSDTWWQLSSHEKETRQKRAGLCATSVLQRMSQ